MFDTPPQLPLERIAQALALPHPAQALRAVLAIADEAGITPCETDPAVWLTLSHEQRTLALAASDGPPAHPTIWADLLQAAFARAVEHELLLRGKEREELLHAASFEGLFFHIDGCIIDANQRLCEMSGYDRSEILGDQLMQRCIAPEDIPSVRQRMAERYEGAYVITGVRKNGTRFRAELQAKQGKLGDRPVRVIAVRDVTEREQSQELLRESELRLRNLAEETFDITVFSARGVVLDAVGSAENMLGYQREQLIGHHVLEFVPESRHAEVSAAHATQRTGAYETALVSASGEEVPIEAVAVNVTLNGEPVRMTAMRDLREVKRQQREHRELERAFEQSQRLESLGVLAGGIAHDFNNLLTVVLGHAELLQRALSSSPEQALARGIVHAAQRAAGLTAQMLAYAGRSELGPRTAIDLSVLVEELRSLLDAGLSKKAQITLSLADHALVLGNRATLTQVIMNLLTNASDALLGGPGSIQLRTSFVAAPEPRFRRALGKSISAGRWVLLEVSDTGIGMDEATQARIFEPFFTTKPQGHGLGLAACVGIVASHGGAILVESRAGQGSTFSVLLPAYGGSAPVRVEDTPPVTGKTHTVLVVDDEPLVRSHLRAALGSQGYEVVEAENGRAALELLASFQPSVVVLDMTMPDLSGVDVLRTLRQQGSGLPVVLSSGYHDADLELDPASFQGFLLKPYRLKELFEVLERAIASGQ